MIESIVAYDINKGIAKNGSLPWKIPDDMKFFKNKTIKNVVIMGRNTFESLNFSPLKDRLNIVITKTPEKFFVYCEEYDNVIFTDNINIHLDIIRNSNEYANRYYFLNKHFKIFCIGGEQLYKHFIPFSEFIWVTRIKSNYNCDTFFSRDLDNCEFLHSEKIVSADDYDTIKYTNDLV